jgi:hypothetical protein
MNTRILLPTKSTSKIRGIAFISAIIFSFLITLLTLYMGQSILRRIEIGSAYIDSIQASFEIETKTLNSLEEFVSNAPQEITPILGSSLFYLANQAIVGRAISNSGVFITLLRTTSAIPSHPSWEKLLERTMGNNTLCITWQVEQLSNQVKVKSAQTCTQINQDTFVGFIAGNIELDNTLHIRNTNPSYPYLVSTGQVSLNNGLHFENLSDASLAIIAMGDISVSEILLTNSERIRLLLHSVNGVVRLEKFETSFLDCDHESTLQLRLESPIAIYAEDRLIPDTYILGCSYFKSKDIWPNEVLLGKTYF